MARDPFRQPFDSRDAFNLPLSRTAVHARSTHSCPLTPSSSRNQRKTAGTPTDADVRHAIRTGASNATLDRLDAQITRRAAARQGR